MRMTRWLIQAMLLLMLMLCMAACGSAKIPLDAVPVPPEATREPFEGGFEVQLDMNDSDIRDILQGKYFSSANANILTLPDATTWDDVLKFYQTALEKDGWTPDADLNKMQHGHYQMSIWSRAAGTGHQAVAIAYVPKGEDDMPNNFLMVFVTR